MASRTARKLALEDRRAVQVVFGSVAGGRELIDSIKAETGVEVALRGSDLLIEGEPADCDLVEVALRELAALASRGRPVAPADVGRMFEVLRSQAEAKLAEIFDDAVLVRPGGRALAPRSLAQKRYVDAMRRCALVFGVGPAGTGKTYLAIAMAVHRLAERQVRRIVLARPAIEAGENLGFLPGTLEEKVGPYMRPLYDALFDMIEPAKVQRMIEQGVIEVAPLAYMRGRTLNDAFVILDEAQNATREQVRMFLTRIGVGTFCVVTGDPTQIDLPGGQRSGLGHALGVLREVPDVAICRFSDVDVMRHPLVQAIVRAYERDDRARAERAARRRADAEDEPG